MESDVEIAIYSVSVSIPGAGAGTGSGRGSGAMHVSSVDGSGSARPRAAFTSATDGMSGASGEGMVSTDKRERALNMLLSEDGRREVVWRGNGRTARRASWWVVSSLHRIS